MRHLLFYCFIVSLVFGSCVKPFNPAGNAVTDFLVVEGVIVWGGETSIKLSRTKNLSDSNLTNSVADARVQIESSAGEIFLIEGDGHGGYHFNGSGLNQTNRYRLKIETAGRNYISDFVDIRQTPEIDSISWKEESTINIYVNTHDAQNNTRYYRWDYIETWENQAAYESYLDFRNGQLVFLDPEEYRFKCYSTDSSNSILIGSSSEFVEDRIVQAPITSIPNDNNKIGIRYSILVRQYSLSKAAYDYWRLVKENSEPAGDIFDPQPAQLFGNIRCVENKNEPVIGFVSASTVTEKRIFIRWGELRNRTVIDNVPLCRETLIELEDARKFLADGTKLPAYLKSQNGPLAIANAVCVDCRLRGGVTTKPSFW